MLEVRLFGAPEVRLDGAPVALASARVHSLLAYLILQRGRPQRRDHLAFLLWPDSTEKQAAHKPAPRPAHVARRDS